MMKEGNKRAVHIMVYHKKYSLSVSHDLGYGWILPKQLGKTGQVPPDSDLTGLTQKEKKIQN